MKSDVLKVLFGAAVAACYGHLTYARWTAKGMITVPVFKGREWGVGKMLTEAAVYGAISVGLGFLAWRPKPREARELSSRG
ncbi:MAG: hypothetical protein FGM50_08055 [Mycobacterium sp.]|nr:hypothetical protein [Mycobacterium sp.]